DCYQLLGRAETINLLDNMKDIGFRESTRSGLSFATDDLKTPSSKDAILAEAEKEVAKNAKLYQRGIITDAERYNKVRDACTHAARKGLADTALKTADSGYLTRKLADVAQNVVITMEDCGTSQGITKGVIYKGEKVEVSLSQSIRGRVSRVNIVNPITDEIVVKENDMITVAAARKLEDMQIEKIQVRSPMTCEAELGICR